MSTQVRQTKQISLVFTTLSLSFAIFLGATMSWLASLGYERALDYYDATHPVVVARTQILEQRKDEVIVQMEGEKFRACTLIRLAAYAVTSTTIDRRTLIYIRAEDREDLGYDRPVGKYDFGVWRIWPTSDAVRLNIESVHQCDTRMVVTRLADIELKTQKE